jgi:hypothetical protein
MGIPQFALDFRFVPIDYGNLAAAEFLNEFPFPHTGHLGGAAGGHASFLEQSDGERGAQVCREFGFGSGAEESGWNFDDHRQRRCHDFKLHLSGRDSNADPAPPTRSNSRREKPSQVAPYWPGMEIMGSAVVRELYSPTLRKAGSPNAGLRKNPAC